MPITATARDGAWDVLIPVKTTKSIVLKAEGVVDYYCKFSPEHDGPGFRHQMTKRRLHQPPL